MPSKLHKKHLEYTMHPLGAMSKRIVYSNAVGFGLTGSQEVTGSSVKFEAPVEPRIASGPSRLKEAAQAGRLAKGKDAKPRML